MANQIRVQVLYTDETGKFTDAIYYSLTGYEFVTPEDIEAEKTSRINNWKETMKTKPEKDEEIAE